jgi:hypothetical protein
MQSDKPSNRQIVNTGLRSNHMTPALTLVRYCRACKLSRVKGEPSRELPSDTSLPDVLNSFDDRFEASIAEPCVGASAVSDDCRITLSLADVSKTYK